jgi:hypothetical protein
MRRKKPRLKKAQRDQQADWDSLVRKWSNAPKLAREAHRTEEVFVYKLNVPRRNNLPSLVTPGENTSVRQSLQYTGTNMIGIAQMSKSNAVPVFSKEDAVSIARMRRS